MSLHIKLSPEAQARLEKQQKQSTMLSIAIAVLSCLLVGLIMTIFKIRFSKDAVPTITATYSSGDTSGSSNDPTKEERFDTPTADDSQTSQVITAAAVTDGVAISASTDIPIFEDAVETITTDAGEFQSSTNEVTVATADIDIIKLPAQIQKRCSPGDREERLKNNGAGDKAKECEAAVVKALDYLKSTQNPDGSWTNSEHPVGMTGLALLTFFGHCETPKSAKYGETVFKAMGYLIDKGLKNGGIIATKKDDKYNVYEHSIATYALGEAYTFTKVINYDAPNLKEVLIKAGNIIVDGQQDKGAWSYAYLKDSAARMGDNSINGWHLQALKACKNSGLEDEIKGINTAVDKCLKFMEDTQGKDGSIGYSGKPAENPDVKGQVQANTLSAVVVLCHQIWDKSSSTTSKRAIDYLDKNITFDYDKETTDLYGHYYASQAMINAGGDYWNNYNKIFLSGLLSAQEAPGSFKRVNGGRGVKATAASWDNDPKMATHYRTCLATLILESYYRFLPGAKGH